MRLRTALSIASLFLLCFTVAVWSSPLPLALGSPVALPETQSVSGMVESVGDARFTLALGRSQNPGKLQFLIDEDTKFQGTLTVGAQATVEYRSEGERNIAMRVVVLPASGFTPL